MKVKDYTAFKKITFKDIEIGRIFKSEQYGGIYIKAFDTNNSCATAVNMMDGSMEYLVCEDDEVVPVEAELVIKWMGVKNDI